MELSVNLSLNRLRVVVAVLLSLGLPISTVAQVVKLAHAPSQEAKQSDSAKVQTPVAHRVGVDESRPLALNLFDAVKMALEQNRDIEVERINVRQAEYDLISARGATDVSVGALSFYEHRTVPVGSLLAGGPNGSLTTNTLNYDFTAQQLLPTGAQWLAGFTNSRADGNSQFASLNPQYNTALNVQIRQPILRNFSIDDARRRINIAQRRLDLSDSQFRQRAIEIVARVQRSYWDLVFALRDVQIQRESVELARNQLERNRRMVNQGTVAPIDLVSVEVELEKRNENVLTATEAVTRAENALKQLMLGGTESSIWNQPLIPTETPDLSGTNFALADAVAAALANRPELSQSNLQQEINKVEVKFFENQTKPQVDLIASYTSTGLSGSRLLTGNPFTSTSAVLLDRVNALSVLAGIPAIPAPPSSNLPDFLIGGYGQSLQNLFSNDFRTFRFGVAFNFPLRNRTAEGQLGRVVAVGRKIVSQRKTLVQSIVVEVRNALQGVETGRQRVETARASREAAEKQSESEQRRFEAGLSTTYFVLERQNALSQAKGRELRAMTDYSKAVAELQRVMGMTLSSANVQLGPSVQGNKN
jgi:outer membrane protein TolC